MSTKIDLVSAAAEHIDSPLSVDTSMAAGASDPLETEMASVDDAIASKYKDMVELLRGYLAVAESPYNLHDETFRRNCFAKLSYGLRKSGDFLAWARYQHKIAYASRKQAEAVAALDNFGTYIADKKMEGIDVKPTEAVRAHYIQIDPDVISALQKEAMLDAIVEQLSTMKQEFMMAISTIKAMAYGIRDSDFLSGSATSANREE